MTLTIEQLESALTHPVQFTNPDLPAIRRAGARRRRARRAAFAVGGVLGASVLAGAGAAVLHRHQPPPVGLPIASTSQHLVDPSTLSPLARKVLQEVPGAKQVSDDVVLIPAGGATPDVTEPGLEVDHTQILPAQAIGGVVTEYRRSAMPGWLYDELLRRAQSNAGSDGSYSIRPLDDGVAVDQGTMYLGCATAPEWDTHGCAVSMLFRSDGGWQRAGGLGSDAFLHEGHPMELFTIPQFVNGESSTLWIGGRDGTDIASVDFVLTNHTRVPAALASGTVSSGDTLFWAQVPSEVADVVARDSDGNVIEDHQVKSCSDPVDCEVR